MRLQSRLLWFGAAGAIGFIVDASILSGLRASGFDTYKARLVSFSVAIVVTWLINRRRTFTDRAGAPSIGEFLRYLSASSVASLLNLGIFLGLTTTAWFAAHPLTALVIATICSMTVNFWSYLKLVFIKKR